MDGGREREDSTKKIIKSPRGPIDLRLVVQPRGENFAADRRGYIGGTDLAPILGISEKKTRFAVWASKVGEVTDDPSLEEESSAGTFLEPFVLRRFGERNRVRVVPTPTMTYRLRSAPFLAANPDGFVYRDTTLAPPFGLVDAKTRSPFVRGAWGAPGTADVPPDELCQVQWYMEILDLPVAYLAVLFDRALTSFVIPRDRELGALMVEEATAFWNDHVLANVAPRFEGPAANDYLRRKYPKVTDPMKDAGPEDDILVARRALLKRHIDVLKDRLVTVEAMLKDRIGGAPALLGQGYIARWGEVKSKTGVDWRAVVNELRSFPVLEDEQASMAVRAAIDAAIARYTKAGDPTRALKVYFKGPRALPAVEIEPIEVAALPAAKEEED